MIWRYSVSLTYVADAADYCGLRFSWRPTIGFARDSVQFLPHMSQRLAVALQAKPGICDYKKFENALVIEQELARVQDSPEYVFQRLLMLGRVVTDCLQQLDVLVFAGRSRQAAQVDRIHDFSW